MAFDFTGRRVVVAGGSRGIGRAIALNFAAAGADVSICARGAAALEDARAALAAHGRRVHAAACDLADAASIARYVPAAAEALKSSSQPTAVGARSGKGSLDPRLQQIYAGERKMGDRNTVLRGVKPIDFSGVRKHAVLFTSRKPGQQPVPAAGGGAALPINQKPAKRPDPIILLSPSASSLLRISNVRAFLETGRY